ncbi:ribonuclease P protein subunit p21 [Ciona intestinalis]
MGKKKGNQSGSHLQKKDVYQRLNYLYQAAHFAISMQPVNKELSKYYTRTMKTLAQKNVVRLHPHVKRTICKHCDLLLIPGVTCTYRNKGKPKQTVVTCQGCGTFRRYLLNIDNKLWHDKPENIANVVMCNKS